MTTLDKLKIGESGNVTAVNIVDEALRRRLIDMGIIPKTKIEMSKVAPLGDPLEVSLRGYKLSLRKDDAKKIEIEVVK